MFYLPITVLLPTLALGSRYTKAGSSKSWYENLLGRAFSDNSMTTDDIRGPVDKVLTNDIYYDPSLSEYESHK